MAKEKVIIILCDTLRAKSLPHYGHERNTTPGLNPIIDEDFTVYSRAYAPAPWTPPSHLSLFTGLYPSQVLETKTSLELSSVFKTLPELFKDSGYRTFAFSANELVAKKFGYGKGIDRFFQLWLPNPEEEDVFLDLKGENDVERILKIIRLMAESKDKMNILRAFKIKMYKRYRKILKNSTLSTNRIMKLLQRCLLENSNENVFCFLNLMQAHNRYNPPRDTRNKFIEDNSEYENFYNSKYPIDHYATEPFSEDLIEYLKLLYEEEILYLDIVISGLIEFLKSNNLYDGVTLVFTSDHGEHFGENGHVQHNFSVYQPVIKIPFYIKWSGKSGNNTRVSNDLVMLQDLYSTFTNVLNHWQPNPESSLDLHSSSKRSWILSQLPDISHDIKHCCNRRKTFAIEELGLKDTYLNATVFDDETKIIVNGSDNIWCYDLKNDPDEESPVPPTSEQAEKIKEIEDSVA